MGRLFWKFFFFILLAQILAALAIGSAFWLEHRAHHHREAYIEFGPPAIDTINAAALTLQYGGIHALREFVKGDREGRRKVFAVDERGHELLGRTISPKVLEQARQAQSELKEHAVVREVSAADGHSYLLFLSRSEGPNGAALTPHFNGKPEFGMRPPPPHERGFVPLIPTISAIVVSLIFAALLAWYFAKPIRNLRTAFQSVSSGNFATRVAPAMGSRRDELADLGKDFDAMANQLNSLMDSQRRLLHDVSHELRSPLARMQAAIGLAHQQPEKLPSSLLRIEKESERMDKLIDEILTLSRLEAGVAPIGSENIHIADLLTEIVEDAQFEAAAKPCTVVQAGMCPVIVKGQSDLLHRGIENVVRNAIKHTEKESVVTIHCKTDPHKKTVHIDVIDCGPGVPEGVLEDIFEPFFRAENNAKNSDGHGLGLAIAKRVVQSMGGSIQAANLPQGGLCISIGLPVQSFTS